MHTVATTFAVAASLLSAVSAQSQNECQRVTSYPTAFEISPTNITTDGAEKRGLFERQTAQCTTNPIITLCNGVLIDQSGRTGSIVANQQFQFDAPVQEDAKATDGFSICDNPNGNITLATPAGSSIYYACNSGDFSNLYDSDAYPGNCFPVYLNVIPCSGGQDPGNAGNCPAASSAVGLQTGSSTADSTMATSASSQPAFTMVMPPASATTGAVIPFPTGNGTAPAPTGGATGAPAPTGTSPTPPSFTGAADSLVAGTKFIAAAAGLAAFFLA